MKLEGEQVLLRVYLRSTDKYGWWRSAVDTLVERPERAAAGVPSFAALWPRWHGPPDCPVGLDAAETVPVIIEIVEAAANVGSFLDTVAEIVSEGSATLDAATFDLPPGRVELIRLTVPRCPSVHFTVAWSSRPAPAQDGQLWRSSVSPTPGTASRSTAVVHKARNWARPSHGPSRRHGFRCQPRPNHQDNASYRLLILIEIVDAADKLKETAAVLGRGSRKGMIMIEAVKVCTIGTTRQKRDLRAVREKV